MPKGEKMMDIEIISNSNKPATKYLYFQGFRGVKGGGLSFNSLSSFEGNSLLITAIIKMVNRKSTNRTCK